MVTLFQKLAEEIAKIPTHTPRSEGPETSKAMYEENSRGQKEDWRREPQ
jgi:hypothetical protein